MKRWGRRIGADKSREKATYRWVESLPVKRRRYEGQGAARVRVGNRPMPNCDAYVEEYLADYARKNRSSSLETQTRRLRRFREDFKGRSLDVSRAELKEWIAGEDRWSGHGAIPKGQVQAVVALYNHAIDEGDVALARSPARKLTQHYPGRAGQPPPTPEQFEALLAGCAALGDYATTMRALLQFAAYTLMRPSELYALEWSDIDFPRMRIHKRRRVHGGELDQPKTGPKLIALPVPALAVIKGLPRDSNLVFTSKTGTRLDGRTLARYWTKVTAAAGVEFHFYHATKHYGVHYMWTVLGLSSRAIAAQAGWKLETANRMLAVYGHGELGVLAEVDEVFQRSVGFPGREVGDRLERWRPRERAAEGGRLAPSLAQSDGQLSEDAQAQVSGA